MINPAYQIQRARELLADQYADSREKSLVLTKLDEAEQWLARCVLSVEQASHEADVQKGAEYTSDSVAVVMLRHFFDQKGAWIRTEQVGSDLLDPPEHVAYVDEPVQQPAGVACDLCGSDEHVASFHRDPVTGLIGGMPMQMPAGISLADEAAYEVGDDADEVPQ